MNLPIVKTKEREQNTSRDIKLIKKLNIIYQAFTHDPINKEKDQQRHRKRI